MLNRSDDLGVFYDTLATSKSLIINHVILGLKWDRLPVSRVSYLLNSIVTHTDQYVDCKRWILNEFFLMN